jgi:ParB family chromosome partitioning protein
MMLLKPIKKKLKDTQISLKELTIQASLTFIIGALSYLRKDENFFNLLRAESLDNLPQYLDEQLSPK